MSTGSKSATEPFGLSIIKRVRWRKQVELENMERTDGRYQNDKIIQVLAYLCMMTEIKANRSWYYFFQT
jgi:hypothetical protein